MLQCASLALVLITWGAVSMTVYSQVDSCTSSFASFLPSPFNASGLNCRPVWKDFILRYSQNKENNTLSILLSAVYTSGWVGIGFSNDGMMIGSSAIVGWIDKEDRAKIKQYYLRGQTSTEVIVDEGELLVNKPSSSVFLYGENIYLAFQLKFSAPVKEKSLLFASSSATLNQYYLTQHDDKASISFDFSAGTTVTASYPHELKRNHGALAIFGWGVLTPVGAIVARYCRQWDPLWFYLHVIIQFGGFLTGFACVMAGIALHNRLHSNVTMHRGLGISILVLGVLQVIAFFLRPDKGSKIRKYWNWQHHWTGRLAFFLAAINIALGIQVGEAGNSWKVGYGIILSCILIAVALLETIRWLKLSQKNVEPPAF